MFEHENIVDSFNRLFSPRAVEAYKDRTPLVQTCLTLKVFLVVMSLKQAQMFFPYSLRYTYDPALCKICMR